MVSLRFTGSNAPPVGVGQVDLLVGKPGGSPDIVPHPVPDCGVMPGWKYGWLGVAAAPVEKKAKFAFLRGPMTLPKLEMIECDCGAGVPVPSASTSSAVIRPHFLLAPVAPAVVVWQMSMAFA